MKHSDVEPGDEGPARASTPPPAQALQAASRPSAVWSLFRPLFNAAITCPETPPASIDCRTPLPVDDDWVWITTPGSPTASTSLRCPSPAVITRPNTANMAFLGVYRALYDYSAQSDEELEIRDGDLLFVLEKSSEDSWWRCRKKAASDEDDEPEGLVPENYIEEAKPTHSAKALYDYTKQTDEEMTFEEGTMLQVYDETDPDWTLVGRSGVFGFAPAIYIQPADASSAAATAPTPAAPPMPTRPQATDAIPGEADYPGPSSEQSPAEGLARIIAQRTGGARDDPSPVSQPRTLAAPPPLASPPPAARPQYTPDESEDDESAAAPPQPPRPQSQAMPSPINTAAARNDRMMERMDSPSAMPSPPVNRAVSRTYDEEYDSPARSPGGFHLYNVHEMVSHMGKNKKLPMTLGINVAKGMIMISPEKSKDGPSEEWTAEKLTHYSIEGKHVFVDLVRPSKSVDFHAGAKDTATEIVAMLGEVAGASRAEGLREVLAASAGSRAEGLKTGKMVYEFMAQGDDEVTVAQDDEVIVLDDEASEEWWKVRRLKNGKEGVVPSSYVEITGTVPYSGDGVSGLEAARSTVEQNRLEEARLAKNAAKKGPKRGDTVGPDVSLPERGSSLATDSKDRHRSQRDKRSSKDKDGNPKAKPNQSRIRTWTDRSGTFKVEAEFIGLREGKIHLHKQNGVKIAVPVNKMAVEDLEYVERATGASLDEDKPLSDIKRRSTQKAKTNGSRAGASIEKKAEYDWFDFFLGCGVNPQICERYANAFSKDQMGIEILPDVNAALLRTLGLKEGDILRVMKHLDEKFGRSKDANGEAAGGEGGLFSGPGGALRNNTRKGRPAHAVQTNDVISEDAFKAGGESSSPAAREMPPDAQATPLASAPARQPKSGFDDDAWDVKPARTGTPEVQRPAAAEPPKPVEPPKPRVNDDIASLSLSSPPLQPTVTPTPAPAPAPVQPPQTTVSPPPTEPQAPQGANAEIFNKIAALAPARQRPQPPPQVQQTGGALGMAPPPRASSAPGFPPQQSGFGPPPLQPQLTGYNQPQQTGYGQQQQFPQQTGFQQQGFPQQGFQPNGFGQQQQQPQQTGLQAMQQNYPSLQPQPTGMAFQPQSQFGQAAQQHHYGAPPMPQQQQGGLGFQQQLMNGAAANSPFADPSQQQQQQQFQPQPTGFGAPQQTSFGQQPQFNISQPTGMNGTFGQPAPQLPPQQTGGVLGAAAPLVPQQTGPAPPVRFGTTGKGIVPQPTGRANLRNASKSSSRVASR